MIRKAIVNRDRQNKFCYHKKLSTAREVQKFAEEVFDLPCEILRVYNTDMLFLGYSVVNIEETINHEWDTL